MKLFSDYVSIKQKIFLGIKSGKIFVFYLWKVYLSNKLELLKFAYYFKLICSPFAYDERGL